MMSDCCSVEALFVIQVRKYRTMTELIVDAIEFVKNPYKGKKLKVRPCPGLFFLSAPRHSLLPC